MTDHDLNIDRVYLDALLDGTKTFELRINDRGYQAGDTLRFFGNLDGSWQRIDFAITYVHSGIGLERNYVILAVQRIKPARSVRP